VLDTSGYDYFYIDGVVDSTVSAPSNMSATTQDVGIGAQTTGVQEFDGLIDDVRMYTRALSAHEVLQLYNTGATAHVNVSPVNTLTDGLVGYWTFDGKDIVTNIADRSGQGNTGFLQNQTPTTTVPGKIGQALNFDGSDDYVGIDSSGVTVTSAATFTAWVKPLDNTCGGGLPLFGDINGETGSNSQYFTLDNNGGATDGIEMWLEIDGVRAQFKYELASGFFDLNRWYHVAYTYDGAQEVIYLDGQLGNSQNNSGAIGSNTETNVKLGNWSAGGPSWFCNQLIDEARIYNRALSAHAIKQLYNMGR